MTSDQASDGGLPPDAAAAIRDALAAERQQTLDRITAVSREFDGIVESSAGVATDDEHDPEGATIAFERAQLAALLDQDRRHLAELDEAADRLRQGRYGRCERCGRPDRRRAARRPPRRPHLHHLRLRGPVTGYPRRSSRARLRSNKWSGKYTSVRCSGTRTAAALKVLTSSVTTTRPSATAASSTRWSSTPRRPGRCAVNATASTPSAARSSASQPG